MFSDVLHGCFQLKMKCGPAQQLAPQGGGGVFVSLASW